MYKQRGFSLAGRLSTSVWHGGRGSSCRGKGFGNIVEEDVVFLFVQRISFLLGNGEFEMVACKSEVKKVELFL
jgi:hypothetical protein